LHFTNEVYEDSLILEHGGLHMVFNFIINYTILYYIIYYIILYNSRHNMYTNKTGCIAIMMKKATNVNT